MDPSSISDRVYDSTDVGSNITVVGAIDRIALKLPSYPPLTQPWDIKESHFCDRYNMPARCAKGNTTICACAHRVKVNLGDIVDVLVVDDREGKNHRKKYTVSNFE